MAVLRRPLPRLTKCGFSVCTFSPLPVSIRSRGLFCGSRGGVLRDAHRSRGCSARSPALPTQLHTQAALKRPGTQAGSDAQTQPGSKTRELRAPARLCCPPQGSEVTLQEQE